MNWSVHFRANHTPTPTPTPTPLGPYEVNILTQVKSQRENHTAYFVQGMDSRYIYISGEESNKEALVHTNVLVQSE